MNNPKNQDKTSKLQLFENHPIRSAWDEEKEEWLFSVVDIIGILTDQPSSRGATKYWNTLKTRLSEEGSELSTKCGQLKFRAKDGKRRLTDVATTEQLLRIIQSVPSKKAEPFKLWLAEVGRERIDETADPEKIAERLIVTYERKGYTREWINQRLQAISARKELTDEWQEHGIKQGKEFAILTDTITKSWSGMSTREYKNFKGLKKESLRDNMSTTELILNMLAETATKELTRKEQPEGLLENQKIAKRGGDIAGSARKNLESQLGESIITKKTAKKLNHTTTKTLPDSSRLS